MSNNNEIKIPDIGDITDAEIIEIAVSEGDVVAVDDTLIVLETEKASMDVPSPAAGTIESIQCRVGDKVSEGSLIMSLSADANSGASEQPSDEPSTVVTHDEAEQVPEQTDNMVEDSKVSESSSDNSPATQQLEPIMVPDLGQDDAVEVIEVSVAPDEMVEEGQTLLTLESEKASMEIPSPQSGKVTQFSAVVGDKLKTGDTIGELEVTTNPTAEIAAPVKADTSAETAAEIPKEQSAVEQPRQAPATPRAPVPDYPAISSGPSATTVYASPAIRRYARELGADLSKIKGSGSKGRIVKEDVQQFIKYELSRPKANANSGASFDAKLPEIDFTKYGEVDQAPLTRIQKVSSVNLQRNWMMIPHVTQHDEADITEMEAFRQSMKDEAKSQGIRLTPLAFMMKAVVASLKAYPRFNASLANDGENLILKKYFHIGVAVDTPEGLVVPVIRDVDQKSVYQLAEELAEVSVKARDKKLGLDAMQGGCFTISSLGGIGGTSFTPIVNWPEVAILGVSKSQTKPIWNGESFEPRLMLPLSVSYDHRVIDGAIAARFTAHLAQTLTDIRRLLL